MFGSFLFLGLVFGLALVSVGPYLLITALDSESLAKKIGAIAFCAITATGCSLGFCCATPPAQQPEQQFSQQPENELHWVVVRNPDQQVAVAHMLDAPKELCNT
jgi:hypothetical protein